MLRFILRFIPHFMLRFMQRYHSYYVSNTGDTNENQSMVQYQTQLGNHLRQLSSVKGFIWISSNHSKNITIIWYLFKHIEGDYYRILFARRRCCRCTFINWLLWKFLTKPGRSQPLMSSQRVNHTLWNIHYNCLRPVTSFSIAILVKFDSLAEETSMKCKYYQILSISNSSKRSHF